MCNIDAIFYSQCCSGFSFMPMFVKKCVICPFQVYAAAGTLKQNYANILLMLLRLRQACDHPLLVKGNESEHGGDGSIEMAKQLPKEVVIDLLAKLELGSAICTVCTVSNITLTIILMFINFLHTQLAWD
jgi:SNF2 family DNA or RNA helicase